MGNALADVLFGDVNPSGKLHITMPNVDNEIGFTKEQYPGTGIPPVAVYSEGLLVGYKYYDFKEISPKFCFGHGLSYTSFKYSDLVVSKGSDSVQVLFVVENNGPVDGSEVSQLYLSFPESAGEPVRQLKGFYKASLASGESATIKLELKPRDMSIWDTESHNWALVNGEFGVLVGSSSRDIRLSTTFIN